MGIAANDNRVLNEQVSEARYLRAVRQIESRLRPYMGWAVLFSCAVLAMLPAATLRANRWVDLGRDQIALEAIGPLAVLTVWWLMGWRRPRSPSRHRAFRNPLGAAAAVLAVAMIGVVVLSQLLLGWIPGPIAVARAVFFERSLAGVGEQVVEEWTSAAGRLDLWWGGVEAGGASQDNLVFAALAGIVLWPVGALTAWLARRRRQGFLAAAPSLWLLGTILLYSAGGRILLGVGLGVAVLLQVLFDHFELLQRWSARGLDYSTGLIVDRLMFVTGALLLMVTLALVAPNLYIGPLADRYYHIVQPYYESLEDYADRLFPGIRGVSRLGGGGLAGGLPNEFLLRSGPDLGEAVVMRVRTSDSAGYGYPYESGYDTAPPGHYMRGGTLATYNGLGWSNPMLGLQEEISAGSRLLPDLWQGRQEVVQTIALSFNTQVLYAAPEPVEASTDVSLGLRGDGDVAALWGRERSYTVVSHTPAVSDEMLAAEQAWGDLTPLPPGYDIHLQLPETVTLRTRDLAAELAEGLSAPYEKARAIEAYLRTYEYDLEVTEPPAGVTDVTDYFLFELKRGYCDYYATAFVTLARLNGLPTRFATGFAEGSWDPDNGIWIITEGDAHSWPEVYFPTYGWIPFEPTAGRPMLSRIALPQTASLSPVGETALPPEDEVSSIEWNWQMLFWLIPLGLAAWGMLSLIQSRLRRREDPWEGLLRWGSRMGRPMLTGQTVLEYGGSLAEHVADERTYLVDNARVAADDIRSLAGAVNLIRYAPEGERVQAEDEARQRWNRLRDYLWALRARR